MEEEHKERIFGGTDDQAETDYVMGKMVSVQINE